MKSDALLPSNLPGVIDRSNSSPSREAASVIDRSNLSPSRKLLGNNAQLFIFIPILIMTKLHPRDPENRQENRFSERRFSGKTVTTG